MRNDSLVKEYVRTLNDDELGYLLSRFTHRIAGDLADIAQFLSHDRDMDRWLSTAGSKPNANGSAEFFAAIDSIEEAVRKEDALREAAHQKEMAAREAYNAKQKELAVA